MNSTDAEKIAQRLCGRYRRFSMAVWALEYTLIFAWIFLAITGRLNDYTQWLIPNVPSYNSWYEFGYIIQLLVVFILIPIPTVFIANKIVSKYIEAGFRETVLHNLCLSCGYLLPEAKPASGGVVVCPECGQRYVPWG